MPAIDPAQARATLGNPLWRLNNLYSITDKQGHVIPFRPNPVQQVLLRDLYVEKVRRLLVLKSRKHGVSTLFDLVILDACYWGENIQASIIDLTSPNAQEKLKNIVRNAWERMPAAIRILPTIDNNSVLEFPNKSVINAGKQARGGQNQILHVSEWGPIAYEDPARSEEIKTGALPSADEGVQLIESTFKGGKGGDFYNLIKRTQETPEAERTAKDFRFRFFPWFQDARNTLEGSPEWINRETKKYLEDLQARLGITLTPGQQLWYAKTKLEQGIFMWREYPSTVDEAFTAPVEGAIFGRVMSELRAAGRLTRVSRDPGAPCFACWDLGWSDAMAVWIFQFVGRDLIWLWYREAQHETMAEMHEHIVRTNIPIAGHALPHDGSNANVVTGRITPKAALEKCGAQNVVIVPAARDEAATFDLLRDHLARSWINAPACERGIEALEAYHTKDELAGGTITKAPVHDWASHGCKSAIYGVTACYTGLLRPGMAQRIETVPRDPDGNVMVDYESVRLAARKRRSMLAKSGLSGR